MVEARPAPLTSHKQRRLTRSNSCGETLTNRYPQDQHLRLKVMVHPSALRAGRMRAGEGASTTAVNDGPIPTMAKPSGWTAVGGVRSE